MPFSNKRTESAVISLAMYSYNKEIGEAISIDEKKKSINIIINGKDFEIIYDFPFVDEDYYNDVQILEMIEEIGKKLKE